MDTKPFVVVDKGRCFRFIRTKKMYIVEGIDIRGVTTQGRTFEIALANAHDAADLMEEFHAEAEEPAIKTRTVRSRLTGAAAKARRSPAFAGK